MSPKDSTYEGESKEDMAKLREAVQEVFAYDPSSSRRASVEPQAVKHRKQAKKGSKRPVRS